MQKKNGIHDDVIKWKHFPRYWPFVRGIHRSTVNSQHKGQWRGALMFSLTCTRIKGWVNNDEAGDLRRHRAHYDVTVMWLIWHKNEWPNWAGCSVVKMHTQMGYEATGKIRETNGLGSKGTIHDTYGAISCPPSPSNVFYRPSWCQGSYHKTFYRGKGNRSHAYIYGPVLAWFLPFQRPRN